MLDEQLRDRLIGQDKAAEILGVQPRTLEAWRQKLIGPRFIHHSARCVRYRLSELQAWVAAHEVNTEAAA